VRGHVLKPLARRIIDAARSQRRRPTPRKQVSVLVRRDGDAGAAQPLEATPGSTPAAIISDAWPCRRSCKPRPTAVGLSVGGQTPSRLSLPPCQRGHWSVGDLLDGDSDDVARPARELRLASGTWTDVYLKRRDRPEPRIVFRSVGIRAVIGKGDFMALFELAQSGGLAELPPTTFTTQHVLERADLQRAIRSNITVIDRGLLVVAEEFGDFADIRRRIDLLCVDGEGQLVVVELKRTEDGGHMELQALRYAAMVSTMTFDQLADTYERFLRQNAPESAPHARATLAEFLSDVGGEDAILERRVRIILVSAGFDTQITTTVLWLNDLYGLNIRCVRLTPYRVDARLLLDVQQVIPLPEAEELMVRLRQRETAAARAATNSGADWTQYVITTPRGSPSHCGSGVRFWRWCMPSPARVSVPNRWNEPSPAQGFFQSTASCEQKSSPRLSARSTHRLRGTNGAGSWKNPYTRVSERGCCRRCGEPIPSRPWRHCWLWCRAMVTATALCSETCTSVGYRENVLGPAAVGVTRGRFGVMTCLEASAPNDIRRRATASATRLLSRATRTPDRHR